MKGKRGQVTIFIIIAILIVGLALFFFLVMPNLNIRTSFDEKNPQAFIQNCLDTKIQDSIEIISLQGGSVHPEHYFEYNDINIQYLCYTNENYKTCLIQKPLLKQNIEFEIENDIREDVVACFNALKENYESRNYNVNLETGRTNVELLPKRVVVSFDYILTVSKGSADRYDSFNVILNNNLYELISIANSIVEWEATVGEADPRLYMTYYPDLKVEKNLRDDGTRIYILTDKNIGNRFQFASRSLVFPPGY
ncbi:hypothetical protein FJZ20_00995 [Candidatus Pacearchaeota archaeon]|nr:hypothetical protein [Candidatus Pacearchaeota archaeon]